jgi:glycosyltransferase involved in cell wall biosynthesis
MVARCPEALGFGNRSAPQRLPIALLEAMSYGLPCLASDIPPQREVISPGVNGYLFAADSKADLVRLLRHVLGASPEELGAVGAAAREHVRAEYDWERVVDQVEGVYRSLVS